METRVDKAAELFKGGYNCAQAVFVTYADLFGLDREMALKISSSFGGGMGGMRETCGSVSGMFMIAGLHNGVTVANDKESKKLNYETVQILANEFKNEHGSIICKQLLGLEPGLPADKKKKPCAEYVKTCSLLIEKYLLQSKI